MREKFNEKRAKWLARSKQRGTEADRELETNSSHSPRSSSAAHTVSSGNVSANGSDADSSLSLRSGAFSSLVQVHTTEMETQTDAIGGGGCVVRTPSPARRRRIQLELQLQQEASRKAEQANT